MGLGCRNECVHLQIGRMLLIRPPLVVVAVMLQAAHAEPSRTCSAVC